jgi:hypothetical protein
MARESWVLVHSPLLGPGSWAPVARELRSTGAAVRVPDLRPVLLGGPGYAERAAALAAEGGDETPVIVAGHSAAGPLLPAIVAAIAANGSATTACVFVDARRPHPGRTRRSTRSADVNAHLDSLAEGGWLPPWPQWWPPEALTELLPDAARRAALVEDCPRLPVGLFDEPLPDIDTLPASGYLQLSPPYGDCATAAADDGWPVIRIDADHLLPVTAPGTVAAHLVTLAGEATPLRNAARQHVARFDRAVETGEWATFAAGFGVDATMRFTGVPIGPFRGRSAIEAAYRTQPPTDTMTVRGIAEIDGSARVAFGWSAGGTGTMSLRWDGPLVAELVISFD